jgi:hypothetical protein
VGAGDADDEGFEARHLERLSLARLDGVADSMQATTVAAGRAIKVRCP